MRKKISHLLNLIMILVMALSYLTPLTQIKVTAATTGNADVSISPKSENSYSITRSGENNTSSKVELNDIRVGDNINFNYSWNIPAGKEPKEGDTFEFDLPQNVEYKSQKNGKFTSNGKELGQFEVSSSGHVKFSFHEFGQTQDGIHGFLNVEGKIKNPSGTDYNLTFNGFPDNSNSTKSYPINSADPSDITVTLHGVPSPINPNRYVIRNSEKLFSEIILNRTNKNMTEENKINTSFSDNLDLNKVKLYKVSLNLDGSIKESSLLKEGDDYTTTNDGYKTISLSHPTQDTIKIDYEFNVNKASIPTSGEIINFYQNVWLSPDSKNNYSHSDTNVTYDPLINVKHINSSSNNHNWRAKYNYNHQLNLKDNELQLEIEGNHYLKTDSIEIYRINNTDTDAEYTTKESDKLKIGSDFEINDSKIKFKDNTSDGVYVKFQTITNSWNSSSDKETLSATGYSNNYRSTDKYDIYKTGINNLSFILYQQDEPVNYEKSTARWHYDIHTKNDGQDEQYDISNNMPDGLELSENPNFNIKVGNRSSNTSLQINETNDNTFEAYDGGTHFTITTFINDNRKKDFKVKVTGVSKRYYFSFDTKFDITKSKKVDYEDYEIANSATATITSNNSTSNSITSQDTLELEAENYDGFVRSIPDVSNRLIVFDNVINPGRQSLSSAPIVNTIDGGDIINVKIYKANLKRTGQIDDSSLQEVSNPRYDMDSKQIKFYPENGSTDIYLIKTSVSLSDRVITQSSKIDSSIEKITNNGKEKLFRTSVSIPNNGKFIEKYGEFSSTNKTTIDWTVYFNKSQSKLKNAIVFDKPSNNQVVNDKSVTVKEVKFNGTNIDEQSTNDSESLVNDKDYKITKNEDNSFELQFTNTIIKSYKITYSTVTKDTSASKYFSNDYKFSSNNLSYDWQRRIVDNPFVNESDISFISKKYTLRVMLNGNGPENSNPPLNGANFELKNHSSIATGITFDNGYFVFDNLEPGTYTLIQSSSVDSYTIPEDLKKGIQISINPGKYENDINVSNNFTNNNSSDKSNDSNRTEDNKNNTGDNNNGNNNNGSNNTGNNNHGNNNTGNNNTGDNNHGNNNTGNNNTGDNNHGNNNNGSNNTGDNNHGNNNTGSNNTGDNNNGNNNNGSNNTGDNNNGNDNTLPQTGQNNDLTLKYIGIIIILLSGFILYPTLKKRR